MSAQFDPILGQMRDGAVTLAEQTAGYNKGSAAEKAAFQSSVSGYAKNIAQRIGKSPMCMCVFGNSITASPPNYANMLSGLSGGTLVATTNAGVAGNTTSAMLARIASVSASEPLVPTMECTNDSNPSNSISTALHVQNMRDIFSVLLNRGQLPLVILPPPFNTYPLTQNKLRLADFMLAVELGLPCYDPWVNCSDLTTGFWKTGYDNADGTHPTFATNAIAAADFWAQISTNKPAGFALNRANANQAGLWPNNALFLTDTNADGVPDGWSTGGTLTKSIGSEVAPSLGNYFQLSVTTGNVAYAIGPSGTVSAGNKLLFCGYYAVSSIGTLGTGAQASVSLRLSSGLNVYAVNYQPAVSPLGFFYFEYTVPTGITSVAAQLTVNAGTGTTTLRASNLQCYNLSTMYS